MSYDVSIGEGRLRRIGDCYEGGRVDFEVEVEYKVHRDAPIMFFGKRENYWAPPYAMMGSLEKNLPYAYDLVRDLLMNHGQEMQSVPITIEHADRIVAIRRRFMAENPDVVPDPHGDLDSVNAGRLAWLEFWILWALENCENPTCEAT